MRYKVHTMVLGGLTAALLACSATPAEASSQGSTATAKQLKVASVQLRNNVTTVTLTWQGKSKRTYEVLLADADTIASRVSVRAPKHCWGQWCDMKVTLDLPAGQPAGAVVVRNVANHDMLARQVFDPYTFGVLYGIAQHADWSFNGAWNALNLCSEFSWQYWPAWAQDRLAINDFYRRRDKLAAVMVATLAVNATEQEWLSVGRTDLVVEGLAGKVATQLDQRARKYGYDWQDFLPTPSQLSGLAAAFAANGLPTDAMCARHA